MYAKNLINHNVSHESKEVALYSTPMEEGEIVSFLADSSEIKKIGPLRLLLISYCLSSAQSDLQNLVKVLLPPLV